MPVRPEIAAFIDRDGVINADLGHVWRPEEFQLLSGAVEGLRCLALGGYRLVVITNQAGIAKGLYGENDYQHLTRYMTQLLASKGVQLSAVYHCPHHPDGVVARYAVACGCRKPAPGMLLLAADELNLDLTQSVLIGDKESDIAAGRAAGLRWTVLVDSGHSNPPGGQFHSDCRCRDLASAADWICSPERNPGRQGVYGGG